jgi:hypothetical protein
VATSEKTTLSDSTINMIGVIDVAKGKNSGIFIEGHLCMGWPRYVDICKLTRMHDITLRV